jgi:hypothetical protein
LNKTTPVTNTTQHKVATEEPDSRQVASPNSKENLEETKQKEIDEKDKFYISPEHQAELDKQMGIIYENMIKRKEKKQEDEMILASMENDIEKEINQEEYEEFLQQNCPDEESIASKQTVRNTNTQTDSKENKNYDDTEFESENEENTVDLSRSTQYNKIPLNKEIPPKCICYQIGINLERVDIQALQKEFEGLKKQEL